jgi:hypothetical protein
MIEFVRHAGSFENISFPYDAPAAWANSRIPFLHGNDSVVATRCSTVLDDRVSSIWPQQEQKYFNGIPKCENFMRRKTWQ